MQYARISRKNGARFVLRNIRINNIFFQHNRCVFIMIGINLFMCGTYSHFNWPYIGVSVAIFRRIFHHKINVLSAFGENRMKCEQINSFLV